MTQVAAHDPGGKVRITLPGGVIGRAEFCGENDSHRIWLDREWDELDVVPALPGYLLYIGMNPSTADAGANDPTIGRETFFTKREGYRRFVKCNVMSFRATEPRYLRAPGIVPSCDENSATIERYAADAAKIICCWGAVHKSLQHFPDSVEAVLRRNGHELWRFGLTGGLAPRHPLYVRGDAPLIPFEVSR